MILSFLLNFYESKMFYSRKNNNIYFFSLLILYVNYSNTATNLIFLSFKCIKFTVLHIILHTHSNE